MTNKLTAEFIGSFVLVFIGAGAAVADGLSGGEVSKAGVSITFGLVVTSMIYSIGSVSGAHINPAVSFGFWAAGKMRPREAISYAVSQCFGALTAALALKVLFPAHAHLAVTLPSGSIPQSLLLEFIMTAILMYVILAVATGSKEQGIMAGVAIGAVVGMEAMFGGGVSGASMNPARSFGPALAAMRLEELWIYIVAPCGGAAAAVPLCRLTHGSGCCGGESKIS